MPELPEVETTVRGICPHVVGRRIREVEVRERRLRWPIDSTFDFLAGQRVLEVTRRAKYLLLRLDSCGVLLHLGMSGSLRLLQSGEELRPHDHWWWRLDDGMSLVYHDPRRFGSAHVLDGDRLWQHPLLDELGPEPLSDAFHGDHLYALSRARRTAIKNFIMDGHIVVGVGNIYACEALFLAGIRPSLSAARLSRQRCHRLADSIRDVLSAAIEMGGTTLRDFVNPQGQAGYFKQTLNVYGRQGQPCRICKELIRVRTLGQRSNFFCINCQKG